MNNILSVLENYTFDNADDIARVLADDFRKRRIEKNLIALAMAMDYTSEIKNVFSQPKYSTMEELTQIRKNTGKSRAYKTGTGKKERKDL